ncbi:hypothetical protein CALCODRAFT_131939 [Calocera cornea HHB12733]|uniref:Uncharacterized protein n=1 Tax=Calocera cornea HHB12733 TaxID=1353952 RepID=A0A165CWE2_9BASI|nr:hypothetical protein CALCODRAFT_131939 [Calocera cornea HHB12733]
MEKTSEAVAAKDKGLPGSNPTRVGSHGLAALAEIGHSAHAVTAVNKSKAEAVSGNKKSDTAPASGGTSGEKGESRDSKGARLASLKQAELRFMYWERPGALVLDCTMGMSGPLRSIHGCRSVEEAKDAVKGHRDKAQIRGCPVFIIRQDPDTLLLSEEIVGFVVPSRGGQRPSGGKLDVMPVEERATLTAGWNALVERDQM